MTVTIAELWCYPIKSTAGTSLQKATVLCGGIENDRRWMVVDSSTGRFLTQREHRKMAQIVADVSPGALNVNAPGMPTLVVPVQGERPSMTVGIWSATSSGLIEPPEASAWFSEFLGADVALVRGNEQEPRLLKELYRRDGASPVAGFADFAALHLTSQASLDELSKHANKDIPMSRFRPNIVVAGAAPYEEDAWGTTRFGSLKTHTVRPVSRCVITDIDQVAAQRASGVLNALAKSRAGRDMANPKNPRGLFFGQYLAAEGPFPQELHVGDSVEVTSRLLSSNVELIELALG